MRHNLVWALSYNAVMVAVAALGWLAPQWAALAMALSSLTVTLAAVRVGATLEPPHSAVAGASQPPEETCKPLARTGV